MPSVLKDHFLSLNSHIFFFVVDQCQCRQHQASKTADICSAFEPQFFSPTLSMLTNEFYFIVARSQRLNIAARMSFEPANLFTCDSNYYLINFIQSIHAEIPYVGAVNTRRFKSGYSSSISIHPLFYRRNRSLVKSTSGFARSHSRFSFEHGSRILQSLLTKIKALYAKVHLNLSRKVQPSFNFIHGLWS